MKIYNSQEEVYADIKNNELVKYDDITFNCDIAISEVKIIGKGIYCKNLTAKYIHAIEIIGDDISAQTISAHRISCNNLRATLLDVFEKNVLTISK